MTTTRLTLNDVPPRLRMAVGDDTIDFICYSKREQSHGVSINQISFGIAGLLFCSLLLFLLYNTYVDNGVSNWEVYTTDTDNERIGLIVLLVILLAFLYATVRGILSAAKEGGSFIGTSKRLIRFRKNTVNYFDWEQFTGRVDVNVVSRYVMLERQQKEEVNDILVHKKLFLTGLEQPTEVGAFCQQRINENQA